MTGFAHLQIQTELGLLSIELKSVNSRYQEVAIRLPEELKFLEGEVRGLLSQRTSRGKIECRMQWIGSAMHEQVLNPIGVKNLLSLQEVILKDSPDIKALTVFQILSFPGVLQPRSVDFGQLKKEVLNAVLQILEIFLASRVREGEALSKIINDYCFIIVQIVNDLKPKIPEIVKNIQNKLEERLEEAFTKALANRSSITKEELAERIRQEVVLYAIKLDVDEEMNRILTHVNGIQGILSEGGNVGKRLDFMIQELNREANTLGSKAVDIEMTKASLALKVTIEKIREQIQNLE